jgi:hypothetical protein
MPDYEVFIAAAEVARAGGDEVGLPANYLEPDADRFPFCDEVMLCTLWELMTGKEVEAASEEALERVYEASQDGPWVERLNEEFADRLRALTPREIEPMAQAWSETEEFRWMIPEPPEPAFAGVARLFGRDRREERAREAEQQRLKTARANLEALVRLAQRAKKANKNVYLWCGL